MAENEREGGTLLGAVSGWLDRRRLAHHVRHAEFHGGVVLAAGLLAVAISGCSKPGLYCRRCGTWHGKPVAPPGTRPPKGWRLVTTEEFEAAERTAFGDDLARLRLPRLGGGEVMRVEEAETYLAKLAQPPIRRWPTKAAP